MGKIDFVNFQKYWWHYITSTKYTFELNLIKALRNFARYFLCVQECFRFNESYLKKDQQIYTRWWFQIFFYFHPYLGR